MTPEAADWSHRIGAFAPLWWLGVLLAAATALGIVAQPARHGTAPLWLPLISALPWLPVPLPPAALLAVGPLGQLLAAACLLAYVVTVVPVGVGVERVRPLIAVLQLAVLFGTAAWWVSPRIPGGDEPHYLIITQSLLADGDLRIENNHQRREYVAYVDAELKPDYLRRGRDGAIYSIHAPGISAVVLPAFLVAGYPGAVVMLALLAAVGVVIVWCSAHAFTGSLGAAYVAAAGVGLSVPFFFQTFTIYPDGPAAVAVAAVVWLALTRTGGLTWPMALACGALLGALPWLHTRYAAIAGPLGLVVAARIWWPRVAAAALGTRLSALGALALPALSSAVAWFAMFQAIYGTWDPRAPYGHATDMRWARIPHGVAGLLLDQQFGLIPNAPIFVAALAGFGALWRKDRRITLELLAAIVPYVAAVAGFHMWWGGRSSPSRFLVPVLLPLALPLAAWWSDTTRRPARAVTLVLLAASLCLTAAFVLVDHGALIYNSRDGHALWLLAAAPSVNLTYALPSLFQGGPVQAWLVAGGWLTAVTAAGAWLRFADARGPAIGPWLAAVLGASAFVIASGASLGWALSPRQAWDPGHGLLTLAARACDPAALGTATRPPRIGRVSALVTGVPIADASRRPPRADGVPRWAGTDVPPGRYRLVVSSGLNVSGTATISLGRPEHALTSCAFAEAPPGVMACDVALPAGAAAIWITADAELARTAESLALALVEPGNPDVCGLRAARAVVSPTRPLFVVGGRAWTEGGGLWTEAGESVQVAAAAPDRGLPLRIRQGAASGAVSVTSGSWRDERRLEAGAVWDLDIPIRPSQRVAVATVSTAAGFRPSDLDPSSADTRRLGAWVEPR